MIYHLQVLAMPNGIHLSYNRQFTSFNTHVVYTAYYKCMLYIYCISPLDVLLSMQVLLGSSNGVYISLLLEPYQLQHTSLLRYIYNTISVSASLILRLSYIYRSSCRPVVGGVPDPDRLQVNL